jgi:tetratricopeptide (TPR) repeat protein
VRLAVLLVVFLGLCLVAVLRRPRPAGADAQWYDRGVQAAAQGDLASATQDYERAVAVNPRFAPAYDLLAACYLRQGRVDRALEALGRFAAIDTDHAYAATRLAETYAPVDARYMLRWAREAVLQGPRSPRAHMLVALGLARQGAGREALSQAQTAQQLSASLELAQALGQAAPYVGEPVRLSQILQSLVAQTPY